MLFCAARYDWLSGSNQRWCCSCSAVNVCSRAKSLNQDGVRETTIIELAKYIQIVVLSGVALLGMA